MRFAAVALLDAYGFAGVFGMVAVMYAIWSSPPLRPRQGRTLEEVNEQRLVANRDDQPDGLTTHTVGLVDTETTSSTA